MSNFSIIIYFRIGSLYFSIKVSDPKAFLNFLDFPIGTKCISFFSSKLLTGNFFNLLRDQTLVCVAEARLVRDCLFNHLCHSRLESESGGPSQTRAAAFQPGWCRGPLPQVGGPRTLGYHLNGSSQLRNPCGPARPARGIRSHIGCAHKAT